MHQSVGRFDEVWAVLLSHCCLLTNMTSSILNSQTKHVLLLHIKNIQTAAKKYNSYFQDSCKGAIEEEGAAPVWLDEEEQAADDTSPTKLTKSTRTEPLRIIAASLCNEPCAYMISSNRDITGKLLYRRESCAAAPHSVVQQASDPTWWHTSASPANFTATLLQSFHTYNRIHI